MQHLDHGTIQELIDGEIPSHELPPIQAHLGSCAACRSQLDAARLQATEADELLVMLDDVEPASPATIPLPILARKPQWSRRLALAASLVAAVGLGYAGRDTIDSLTGLNTPQVERGTRITAPESPSAVGAESQEPPVSEPRERETAQRAADVATTAPSPVASTETAVERPAEEQSAAPAPTVGDQVLSPPAPALAGTSGSADLGRQRSGLAVEGEWERRENAFEDAAITTNAFRQSEPALGVAAQASRDAAKALSAAREVDLPEAMEILGGSIKLIDGMVPTRLEAIDNEVRVVYRVIWGEVVLSQQRVGDRLDWSLTGPAGLPGDSLAVLRGKVRP